MNEYITEAKVDEILGADWEGDGDKAEAVLLANSWLTARGVRLDDPVEDPVLQAGARLAREAANDRLYVDSKGAIKRKRVKAEGVETETEFQDFTRAQSGVINLIYDLLAPYLQGAGSNFAVRRG